MHIVAEVFLYPSSTLSISFAPFSQIGASQNGIQSRTVKRIVLVGLCIAAHKVKTLLSITERSMEKLRTTFGRNAYDDFQPRKRNELLPSSIGVSPTLHFRS